MHKAIADRWIKALRSGRYKQTKNSLELDSKNCCLGVLCRILRAKREVGSEGYITFDGWHVLLPTTIERKAGMRSTTGYIYSSGSSLAGLNDGGTSFKTIADIIEAHWEEL